MENADYSKIRDSTIMGKIDWYIIKKYLTTFVFSITMLAFVSIAIDLSEKISRLMDQPVTWKEIVFDYYLNFIPWILGLLAPVFALISVIFFTGRLAKNNEILAILNAGANYWRFLRPFLLGGLVIAVLLWLGGNYVIPKASKKKNTFENAYIFKSNRKVDVDNVHFFIGPETKAYVRYFRLRDTSLQGFRIETFKDHTITAVLKAEKAVFKSHPNTWTLHDYTIHEFNGEKESVQFFKQPKDTVLSFVPDDFISYINDMEMMTTPELVSYIEYEKSRGVKTPSRYILELHRRTADPVTILILTIIGVSVSSRKSRGGMGLNLAIGVAVGAIFVFLQKFSNTFATGQVIPAELGMWIPNIIFFLVAIYFVSKAQK